MYRLEGVLGSADALRVILGQHTQIPAVLVPLRQGIGLVPMTAALSAAADDGASADRLGFSKLPSGFDRVLADWSTIGPIGYVEADYWAGVGSQRAALWAERRLDLGPLVKGEEDEMPAEGSPISQVLARLGVHRTGHHDELAAVGLMRNRSTDSWLQQTAPGHGSGA